MHLDNREQGEDTKKKVTYVAKFRGDSQKKRSLIQTPLTINQKIKLIYTFPTLNH